MSNLGETVFPFKFTSKLRLLWCGLPHNYKQVGLHARPEVVVPGGMDTPQLEFSIDPLPS